MSKNKGGGKLSRFGLSKRNETDLILYGGETDAEGGRTIKLNKFYLSEARWEQLKEELPWKNNNSYFPSRIFV